MACLLQKMCAYTGIDSTGQSYQYFLFITSWVKFKNYVACFQVGE